MTHYLLAAGTRSAADEGHATRSARSRYAGEHGSMARPYAAGDLFESGAELGPRRLPFSFPTGQGHGFGARGGGAGERIGDPFGSAPPHFQYSGIELRGRRWMTASLYAQTFAAMRCCGVVSGDWVVDHCRDACEARHVTRRAPLSQWRLTRVSRARCGEPVTPPWIAASARSCRNAKAMPPARPRGNTGGPPHPRSSSPCRWPGTPWRVPCKHVAPLGGAARYCRSTTGVACWRRASGTLGAANKKFWSATKNTVDIAGGFWSSVAALPYG